MKGFVSVAAAAKASLGAVRERAGGSSSVQGFQSIVGVKHASARTFDLGCFSLHLDVFIQLRVQKASRGRCEYAAVENKNYICPCGNTVLHTDCEAVFIPQGTNASNQQLFRTPESSLNKTAAYFVPKCSTFIESAVASSVS